MATQQSLDTVQSLYVAYYGRPADPSGLQYWAERLEASDGNLSEIINAFGNSAEYSANIGNLGASAQVNNLYQQLFGRDAEDEGRDFYTNMLNSGEKTLAEIALTISEAAQESDRTTYEGRTAVANAFTQELDTPEEIDAYSTERGIGIGRDYLQRVTEQTSSEELLSEAAPVVGTLLPEDAGGNPSPAPTLTITLDETGTITVGGNSTKAITLTESDSGWTFTRGGVTQTVPADDVKSIALGTAALTANAKLLDGIAVTGTGQLTLEELTSDLDLSALSDTLTVNATIAIDQDISAYNNLDTIDTYTVNSNATLTLTTAQASDVTIAGVSADDTPDTPDSRGGSVVVLLDGGADQAAYDLSNITAGAASDDEEQNGGTLVATLTETATLNEDTKLGDFTLALGEGSKNPVELTLSTAQAAGRNITGDANDRVIIEGYEVGTDLSGIGNTIPVSVKFAQAETINITSIENLDNFDTLVVPDGSQLTLSLSQADGKTVEAQGNGTVVVTGSLDSTTAGDDNEIDLTGLPTNFSYAGTDGETTLTVGAGVTLRLTAAQADERTVVAYDGGTVVVTGSLDSTIAGDDNEIDLTGLPTDFTFSGTDGAPSIPTVGAGMTLRLTAAQADERTVVSYDGGTVVVTGSLDSTIAGDDKNIDLTGLPTDFTFAGTDGAPLTPTVGSGVTLRLTAAQADGRTVEAQEGGTVVVTGSLDSNNSGGDNEIDLTGLPTNFSYAGSDGETTLTVGAGTTLRLTAAQADERTVVSYDGGTVVVTGSLDSTIAGDDNEIDLTGLPTDFTFEGTDEAPTLTVGSGVTLRLTAEQADGLNVEAQEGGTVIVTGSLDSTNTGGDNEIDLTGLPGNIYFEEDSPTVGPNVTLKLTAAQADVLTVEAQDGGTVVVTGSLDVNMAGADKNIDLTGLPTDFTFAGTDGAPSIPTVGSGVTLTLTAAQADGRIIEAQDSGTVVVTGPLDSTIAGDDNEIDLTGLPGNISFAEDSLTVGSGVTLRLTAAQADGKTITGEGNVIVEDLSNATFNLSSIAVTGTQTIDVRTSVELAANTDLGTFELDVNSGASLTITNVQANSLEVLTGAGQATIIGDDVFQQMNYSSKNDWDIAVLYMEGRGGNDTLYAPVNVDFVGLRGGEGLDLFEVYARPEGFRPVYVLDYDIDDDSLVINKGAEALISLLPLLEESTSFNFSSQGSNLTNNGTLRIGGIAGEISVTGSNGDDVFGIFGYGATLNSYQETDIIDFSSADFNAEDIKVNGENDNIVVTFGDSQRKDLILTDALNSTITFEGDGIYQTGDGAGYSSVKVNITGNINESAATDDVNLLGGSGIAPQTLTGGAGDDTLYGGGGGENHLYGGAGDDVFYADSSTVMYDGGSGSDRIVVFQSGVDISNATVSSVESLVLDNGNNTEQLDVTISQDQLSAFTDENGESTIDKESGDRIFLNADGDNASDSTITLAGSDGILHAINNLQTGDSVDFSGLFGETTFRNATDNDPEGGFIGFANEGGQISASDVDEAGEWTFARDSELLTYFDGNDTQTITLTGVNHVSSDGGGGSSLEIFS